MRVNVYAEELTERIEIVDDRPNRADNRERRDVGGPNLEMTNTRLSLERRKVNERRRGLAKVIKIERLVQVGLIETPERVVIRTEHRASEAKEVARYRPAAVGVAAQWRTVARPVGIVGVDEALDAQFFSERSAQPERHDVGGVRGSQVAGHLRFTSEAGLHCAFLYEQTRTN